MRYAVTVDAGATKAPAAAAVDRLMDALSSYGASVSADDRHKDWAVTLSVPADTVAGAGVVAAEVVLAAARGAGFPSSKITAVEALTEAEQDRRLELPLFPELVGAAEAAELLGVSRQRIHEMRSTTPGFPEPAVELRMGPLWVKSAIESFLETWVRRPGRPRKSDFETAV